MTDAERPICWGCECEVPVRDGYHVEETGIPGTVYVYPCKADAESLGVRAREGAA